MDQKDDLQVLEHIIGYHFFKPQYLTRALTRPAYAHELIQKNQSTQTQEAYSLLGEAVLKTCLILFLLENDFQDNGAITEAKENLENRENLAKIAKRLKLRKFIRINRSEKDLWKIGEETILAETVEAIIGAIYLDSEAGLGVVRQCIGRWFGSELARIRLEEIAKNKGKSSHR